MPLELLLSPVALALLGLCVGSFLNVVAHRLPLMLERQWWADVAAQLGDADSWRRVFGAKVEPPRAQGETMASLSSALQALPRLGISRPRSRCPACGHQLAWHENIPVLGWLRLRGRCAACSAKISARYPVVELLTMALFAAAGWRFGATAATLVWCTAIALMIAMALIDLDTTLLPDDLTLPLIGLGIVAAGMGWTATSLDAAAWGAFAGYFSLWLISTLYRLIKGVEGIGQGDFKLLAGLGALMGWQLLPSVVLLASGVGALVGIAMIVFGGHKREVPIPFGPYLVGGGLCAIFFGPGLTRIWWPAV